MALLSAPCYCVGFSHVSMMAGGKMGKQAELLKKMEQVRQQKAAAQAAPSGAVAAPEIKPAVSTGAPVANTDWRTGQKLQPTVVEVEEATVQEEYALFEDLLEKDSELCFREGALDADPADLPPDVDAPAVTRSSTAAAANAIFFEPGDFAPLEVWAAALRDTEGAAASYASVRGARPLVIIADARPANADMRETLIELNRRFPRAAADLVAITPDTPAQNRRVAKKSNLFFPLLSDESREWLRAYLVTARVPWEKMVFVLEPRYGRFTAVVRDVDSLSVVEQVKEALKRQA
ncbi:hypothetical protein JKP88DRAFT_256542 [Tribonema minus]|uniref:Alkyl hydroperoxide reductase subunit C/ Thiol specific antioxidant domain-containing protein n=1 Tax=Tribonema minus TaxID=303371 RepID=A0A835YU18_9STRA|nr:hypothetical protein JKP88DRAFT_256542 [Tribonema minus]